MDYESNDKLFSLKKSNSFNLSATEKTLLLSRLCRIYTSRHCLRNHCHAMSKGFNSFVAILTVKPPSGQRGFERQENGVSGFRADEHYEAEHTLSLDETIEDLGFVCRSKGGHL